MISGLIETKYKIPSSHVIKVALTNKRKVHVQREPWVARGRDPLGRLKNFACTVKPLQFTSCSLSPCQGVPDSFHCCCTLMPKVQSTHCAQNQGCSLVKLAPWVMPSGLLPVSLSSYLAFRNLLPPTLFCNPPTTHLHSLY